MIGDSRIICRGMMFGKRTVTILISLIWCVTILIMVTASFIIDTTKIFTSSIPNEEVYFVNLLMNTNMFSRMYPM